MGFSSSARSTAATQRRPSLPSATRTCAGTNLTAAERALFTRRRKEAYEALHPETKNGATGRNHERQLRQLGEAEPERFTLDTAKKTGQSERAIQRDAARGEKVSPELLNQIAGTKLDTGKTLDELAAVPKEEQPTKLSELKAAKAARLFGVRTTATRPCDGGAGSGQGRQRRCLAMPGMRVQGSDRHTPDIQRETVRICTAAPRPGVGAGGHAKAGKRRVVVCGTI